MKLLISLLTLMSICFAGNFTRAGDIVTDNNSGLQWQDNNDSKKVVSEWSDAVDYCENLTLGGYSDWKLPNIAALRSIIDPSKKMPITDRIFQYTRSDFYWSSTTDDTNEHKALAIHFGLGNEVHDYKYDAYSVRCARTVK